MALFTTLVSIEFDDSEHNVAFLRSVLARRMKCKETELSKDVCQLLTMAALIQNSGQVTGKILIRSAETDRDEQVASPPILLDLKAQSQ